MSSRAHLVRTSREWVERLDAPGADEEEVNGKPLHMIFCDDAEAAGAAFDSSEYWGLVGAALEGPTPAARGAEGHAYDAWHRPKGGGVILDSFSDPAEVKATYEALARIDEANLARRLGAVGEEDETPGKPNSLWEDLWQEFEDLRAFYADAAAAGEWVVSLCE